MSFDPKKFFPQVSPRIQLFAAMLFWLIGAGMLLRLAMIFLALIDSSLWWIPPIGLVFGLFKAYFLMIPSAEHTVDRIKRQGRDWLFNCYSPRTYLLISSMIVVGILLRTFGPIDQPLYQQFLAVLYLTVGIGLFLSDGVYLQAYKYVGKDTKKQKEN